MTSGAFWKFYWNPELGEFKPELGLPLKAGWSCLQEDLVYTLVIPVLRR